MIVVRDNGRYPAGNGSRLPGTGSGIAGMRQRALALGGQLDAAPRGRRGVHRHGLPPARRSRS